MIEPKHSDCVMKIEHPADVLGRRGELNRRDESQGDYRPDFAKYRLCTMQCSSSVLVLKALEHKS